MENLQKELSEVNWSLYNGPEYYNPTVVTEKLLLLICLDDETRNNYVYNEVLFTIGNNHAGTYYSAILAALKFIIETALHGNNEVARNCALNILIDLYASFWPEIGTYKYMTMDELKRFVIEEVEAKKDCFVDLSTDSNESDRNCELAVELLEYISENE